MMHAHIKPSVPESLLQLSAVILIEKSFRILVIGSAKGIPERTPWRKEEIMASLLQ